MLQAKSEEVSHVQATWEHHENTMIDAQLQLAELKVILEAAQKSEAESKAARAAAEGQLAAQNSEMERMKSRLAGAEAEMDELRSQVGIMSVCLSVCLSVSGTSAWLAVGWLAVYLPFPLSCMLSFSVLLFGVFFSTT